MTKTMKLTYVAVFSAIATVLMYFEFPIPLMPPFLKIDVSGAVILIGAFIFGIGTCDYDGSNQRFNSCNPNPDGRLWRASGFHFNLYIDYPRSIHLQTASLQKGCTDWLCGWQRRNVYYGNDYQ